MIWRHRPQRARHARGATGFTLIEMVVVIAILGLALTLIVGYRPPWSRGLEIETTAAELAAQLRLMRSEAIARNRSVALELDLAGHRYRGGSGPVRPIPARLAIELLTIAGERTIQSAGGIRFNPDGSSTGGRIILAEGTRRLAIGVDWLTGRTTVADVR